MSEQYTIDKSSNLGTIALIVGVVGLGLSLVGYFTDSSQALHSYLVSFVFWVSIGLGGLFFTMLHHLANAGWSVVLRRISEGLMAVLPLMAVFALPVILGMHDLYHWSHEEAVAHDHLLQKKAGYLNPTFFTIRTVFYFGVWTFLAYRLKRLSLQQDQAHSEDLGAKFRRTSAGGMILFALTSTFAAFDWLMSLDPHWYSTIFGAYLFSGSFLALLCSVILIAIFLRASGPLAHAVSVEHFHDLGKLTFAFIIFWSYMGFSQYFLIWYANIPEETIWFLHRWEGSWKAVSQMIIFGHFVAPFFLLLTRMAKRNLAFLGALAVWILLMRWVDIYWLVFPTHSPHGVHLSWMDVTTMLGIGGIFVWYFWYKLKRHPLIPVKDPRLQESIEFVNS